MHTNLHPRFQETDVGKEAQSIIRSCVHCGFCNATCPTYQELGDERDGPRGRIYLIKQFLEEGAATEKTRIHLDRCLNCRSCETTCPSGVEYGRLLDVSREAMEDQLPRKPFDRLVRWTLRQILPYPRRFTALLRLGQALRPILPAVLKRKVPEKVRAKPWPQGTQQRVMLALEGCAQVGATPNTNSSAAQVLNRLGVTLVEIREAGCCGAVSYHLSAPDEGLNFMRRNIDAWWPAVVAGAEAIVVSASGCASMVKDYGKLLKNDSEYALKAQRISDMAKDLSEVISVEDIDRLDLNIDGLKTAVHCPCSLQHGLGLPDGVEQLLLRAGFNLTRTEEKHLCCGSAGSYSLLQPKMAEQLLSNKLRALNVDNPDRIVTANVGCQMHLASAAQIPVQHWIELVAAGLEED